VLFRRRLTALFAMGVLLVATAAPAFAEKPSNCRPSGHTNCGASLEHRANPSGKGNFGQCHQTGTVDGQQSKHFNPSSQNVGEADCRVATGRGGSVVAAFPAQACEPPSEPVAEGQINFQPELSAEARSGCQ
jgi:hypothetical protein